VADQREPRRGPVDPLLAVAAEAAAAGIRGADYVIEGLNESLRAGVGTRSTRAAAARRRAARAAAARARAAGEPEAASANDDPASRTSVDLFVELLGRFSDEIRNIAEGVGAAGGVEPECPILELDGMPGKQAGVEFTFTNTGASVLTDVTFVATDLLGAATKIEARKVTIDYGAKDRKAIERVGPGRTETVIVNVQIPGDAPEGMYHGCIAARAKAPAGRSAVEAAPEDAWAVIELEVRKAVRKRAIEPAKRRKKT
jgi:hypothetical protein